MNAGIIDETIEEENLEQGVDEGGTFEEELSNSSEEDNDDYDPRKLFDEDDEQEDVEQRPNEEEQTDVEQSDDEEDEDDFDEISLSDIVKTKSKHSERSIGDAGVLTIVNSKKNGKRLSLAGEIIATLQCEEKVQIGLAGKGIAVFPLGNQKLEEFRLKKEGSKHIIYSGPLVQEITERYKLDYSSRTCITFPKVAYKEQDGIKFAYIKIA